jgi:hypothetical protein
VGSLSPRNRTRPRNSSHEDDLPSSLNMRRHSSGCTVACRTYFTVEHRYTVDGTEYSTKKIVYSYINIQPDLAKEIEYQIILTTQYTNIVTQVYAIK